MSALQLTATLLVAAAIASHANAQAAPTHGPYTLERPISHVMLLRDAARSGTVIVALFSLPRCPPCEAVRRDQLRHLVIEDSARFVRVVEYGLIDRKPFIDAIPSEVDVSPIPSNSPYATGSDVPRSPSSLAALLGVRSAPTVVFIGPDGKEIAERLVGYSVPDLYRSDLKQRITQARRQAGVRY